MHFCTVNNKDVYVTMNLPYFSSIIFPIVSLVFDQIVHHVLSKNRLDCCPIVADLA